MRFLYDIFFIIFGFFYIPVLFLKKKLHKDFVQKLGILPDEVTSLTRPVWIHAVSVGEAVLASKLSVKIKELYPDVPVIVSTTTRTGNDMIRKAASGSVDAVFYYPFDVSVITGRVVKNICPAVYIVTETELWPNLLTVMKRNGIPVILANGRISDNSFRNYMKIRWVTRRILDAVSCFCMQSRRDAERIELLGASPDRICVTGSMKFDAGASSQAGMHNEYLKDMFSSEDEDIIIAGSTHFPEESMIIDVFFSLKKDRYNIKLIIAPRHVERVEAIGITIEKKGLKYSKLSELLNSGTGVSSDRDVVLVDTIGHLKDLYSIASVVFIGGSLVKRGGQNPIEAARCEKAVVFGPHMYNFKEVSEIFTDNEAAVSVSDAGELESTFKELLNNDKKRLDMAKKALRVIEDNSGALERTLEKIKHFLEQDNDK